MAVCYSKSLALKTPGDASNGYVVRGITQSRGTITLAELAQHMQDHNTQFSAGNIMGILVDMCACIRELVLEGYIVQLQDLGKFFAHIKKQNTAESSESYTAANNVTKAIVKYGQTSESFTDITNEVKWELVNTKNAAAAALLAASNEINEAIASGSSDDSSDDSTSEDVAQGI